MVEQRLKLAGTRDGVPWIAGLNALARKHVAEFFEANFEG